MLMRIIQHQCSILWYHYHCTQRQWYHNIVHYVQRTYYSNSVLYYGTTVAVYDKNTQWYCNTTPKEEISILGFFNPLVMLYYNTTTTIHDNNVQWQWYRNTDTYSTVTPPLRIIIMYSITVHKKESERYVRDIKPCRLRPVSLRAFNPLYYNTTATIHDNNVLHYYVQQQWYRNILH